MENSSPEKTTDERMQVLYSSDDDHEEKFPHSGGSSEMPNPLLSSAPHTKRSTPEARDYYASYEDKGEKDLP
jgi:hypothetical protein